MKVAEVISELNLEVLNLSDADKEVSGAYSGDLLSWVMGRLDYSNAWITIMNNVNVIAVAALAEASCVILTENSEVDEEVVNKARDNSINLLRTPKTTFETCCLLGSVLNA